MSQPSVSKQAKEPSYQELGDIAFSQGQLDRAASLYSQSLSDNPSSALAEYSLGEIYRCKHNIEQAIEHYGNALQIDPFYNSPLVQLLFMKTRPEQLGRIVSFYRELSKKEPSNPWISVRLGDVLTKQEKIDLAILSYQSASLKMIRQKYPEYVSEHWLRGETATPSYIIIGPMKTATSALYEYINQHSKVLPSIKKEIHFFNDHKRLSYGESWYLAHFPKIPNGSGFITGEASPGYVVNDTQNAIFERFPETKIITLVRNPVDRARSHYEHNVRHGFERRTFEASVMSELSLLADVENPIKLAKKWNWSKYPGYLLLGLYAGFIQEWVSVFPKDQMMIVENRKLSENPLETMNSVFRFLGLGIQHLPTYRRYNTGQYSDLNKDPSIEKALSSFFEPHNRKLEAILHNIDLGYS